MKQYLLQLKYRSINGSKHTFYLSLFETAGTERFYYPHWQSSKKNATRFNTRDIKQQWRIYGGIIIPVK